MKTYQIVLIILSIFLIPTIVLYFIHTDRFLVAFFMSIYLFILFIIALLIGVAYDYEIKKLLEDEYNK
jgi:hypothetical protein